MSANLATQEAETLKIAVRSQQIVLRPYLKNSQHKNVLIEGLPSKHETLSSNISALKKKARPSWAWCLTPKILAVGEVETGRIMVQASTGKTFLRPHLNHKGWVWWLVPIIPGM
jgi:hypothetical protein